MKSSALPAAPSGAPKLGPRATRVRGILAVTLEELVLVGYRALSVEEVAQKAGVNRTTIYRRWPTKKDLVLAAMASIGRTRAPPPDTGSLRNDLIAFGRGFVELVTSIEGQSIFRLLHLESADSEFIAVANVLRREHQEVLRVVVERAIERGEATDSAQADLLGAMLIGAIHLKSFVNNERVDALFIAQVVDVLLHGIGRRAAAGDPAPTKGAR
jgi:AcrR family transcriptional regulator